MEQVLFQCWHTIYDAGPAFGQRCRIRPTIDARCTSQQTQTLTCRSCVVYNTCQVGISVLARSGQSVLLRSRGDVN